MAQERWPAHRFELIARHPQGREIWLDDVRYQLERCASGRLPSALLAMLQQTITMLEADRERFVTYFTLAAKKPG